MQYNETEQRKVRVNFMATSALIFTKQQVSPISVSFCQSVNVSPEIVTLRYLLIHSITIGYVEADTPSAATC